jgi:hypothetical protein
MLQDAFGVISQSTVGEFEALFSATPRCIETGYQTLGMPERGSIV